MKAQITIKKILCLGTEATVEEVSECLCARIQNYLESLQSQPDFEEQEKKEASMQALLKLFFVYINEWIRGQSAQAGSVQNDPGAVKLKQQALEIIPDVQQAILAYLKIMIQANRAIGELQYTRDNMDASDMQNIDWTGDAALLLNRALKEQEQLVARQGMYEDGKVILEKADEEFIKIEGALSKLFKAKDLDVFLPSYKSGLRTKNFQKSQTAIKKLLEKKSKPKDSEIDTLNLFKEAIAAHSKLIEDGKDIISDVDGKTFLNGKEIRTILDAQEKEIEQKRKFILKYQRPYMQNKVKQMGFQRDQLMRIIALNDFINLYVCLAIGVGQALCDMKAVRTYETTLEKAESMKGHAFQEMKVIGERATKIMDEVSYKLAIFRAVT